MKAFEIKVDRDYIVNEFTNGRDFNEIMNLLPHEDGVNMDEEYLSMIDEYLETQDEPVDEYISSLRNGFEYLYGKLPEDITKKDLEGVTLQDLQKKIDDIILDD